MSMTECTFWLSWLLIKVSNGKSSLKFTIHGNVFYYQNHVKFVTRVRRSRCIFTHFCRWQKKVEKRNESFLLLGFRTSIVDWLQIICYNRCCANKIHKLYCSIGIVLANIEKPRSLKFFYDQIILIPQLHNQLHCDNTS